MKFANVLAAAGVTAGCTLLGLGTTGVASAQSTGTQTYMATLKPVPLNGQNSASGTLTLTLNGDVATVHETVSGLASTFMGKPFPHVQHIHGGADGTCPTAANDTNHDGVISTVEGQNTYGAVQTTLSVTGSTAPSAATDVTIAPSGSSYTYDRTITLSPQSLADIQQGNAVIVVHGLDPATAPQAATTEKSPLVPSLPLAATAPALCGSLVASQMSAVPTGGAQTGGGSTTGVQDIGLIVAGGASLAAGAGLFASRRLRHSA